MMDSGSGPEAEQTALSKEVGALGVGMEDKKFACIRGFENKF